MHDLIHRHLHEQKLQGPRKTPDNLLVNILGKITIIAGVIGPLMVVPQIFKIYVYHNAAGVSALSWFAFAILDIPFLLYGAIHKEKPIITTYALWLVANFLVAIGAVIYE